MNVLTHALSVMIRDVGINHGSMAQHELFVCLSRGDIGNECYIDSSANLADSVIIPLNPIFQKF